MGTAPDDITEWRTRSVDADDVTSAAAVAVLTRARESVVRVVSANPRASLLGAVALGFLVAKLVRKISEDWS
jgi:hypothetical protein